MRVSVAWLQSMCNSGLGPSALAERLTRQGLEVGGIWPVPTPSERIVAGRVASAVQLPKTNLKRIEVDAGDAGGFVVVSAAPNVAQGMVGALALPGACLPDGRVIEAREYRGERSEAMLCSAAEVGLGETSDRLLELPREADAGTPLATLYGLPDTCLEVELTPNRGDCLSMLGVAREVHAGTDAALMPPQAEPVDATSEEALTVAVAAPEACPRYLGRLVTGLRSDAATPLWLSERLRRAGLRPTHPVVDVLNYVMLELGQPLHAFDAERLSGGIAVRQARAGEELALLDGTEAKLAADMLVIADDDGPVALAGVMGGAGSAVRPKTRSIFIESAFFAPAAIRGRARRLGLTTDAAHRFERGVDPELPRAALERATALIREIAGGEPGPVSAAEAVNSLPPRTNVRFRPATLQRLTGLDPDPDAAAGVLARLGFDVKSAGEALDVTVPSARFDIEQEADLVEEIARIQGFDRIPPVAPVRRMPLPRDFEAGSALTRVKDVLAAKGYDEAVTMAFAAAERDAALAPEGTRALRLSNPLSEREAVLRRSLWPGLLGALAHNSARQAGRVRLFEAGTVFDGAGERLQLAGVACGSAAPEQWGTAERDVDFFDIKGDVEMLLSAAGVQDVVFEASERDALAAGRRGCARADGVVYAEFGVLAPALAAEWDVSPETVLFSVDVDALPPRPLPCARPVPRLPAVRRDLALVVPAGVTAAELLDGVRRHGGRRLVAVRIFDIYEGAGIPSGHRSIAMGLIFRDLSRTLTDAEVDAAVSAIVTGLGEGMGAYVRS